MSFAKGSRPRVGVVGAGIIGASIAAYLVDAGAEVIVFEKEAPASGATRASLAWINPSTVNADYRDLRLASMAEWHRFQERLQLEVTWGGSISWSDDAEKARNLDQREEVLRVTSANPKHVTEAGIKALSPYLEPGETRAGIYLPQDGHIDPVATTQKILAYAVAKGAQVLHPCSVDEIRLDRGQVTGVRTSKGDVHPLGYLVSACGTDTSALLAKVGVKIGMNAVPGLRTCLRSRDPWETANRFSRSTRTPSPRRRARCTTFPARWNGSRCPMAKPWPSMWAAYPRRPRTSRCTRARCAATPRRSWPPCMARASRPRWPGTGPP